MRPAQQKSCSDGFENFVSLLALTHFSPHSGDRNSGSSRGTLFGCVCTQNVYGDWHSCCTHIPWHASQLSAKFAATVRLSARFQMSRTIMHFDFGPAWTISQFLLLAPNSESHGSLSLFCVISHRQLSQFYGQIASSFLSFQFQLILFRLCPLLTH